METNKKQPATIGFIETEVTRNLVVAFPNHKSEWFALLIRHMEANRFTESEVRQIVTDAIDNIKHPQPTIAEIIYEHKKEKQSLIIP
jgi:hypothetical protein